MKPMYKRLIKETEAQKRAKELKDERERMNRMRHRILCGNGSTRQAIRG